MTQKDYTNTDFSSKNIKLKYELFPEPLNQLRIEIENHPDLLAILAVQQDKDVYMQICEISAYCGVVLSGDYTREDIIGVCQTCLDKLVSKRTLVIL